MTDALCADPWHTDSSAPHLTFIDELPGFTSESYGCKTCGFRTARWSTYIPTEKPCPKCRTPFMGMPDSHDELCADCHGKALDAWIEQVRTCVHEPVAGLCAKCGTGRGD